MSATALTRFPTSNKPFLTKPQRPGQCSAGPATKLAAAPRPDAWIEGKTLSEKLESGDGLIFFTHTLCPFAQRVHLTLIEKVRQALCAGGVNAAHTHVL